ncbi:MULTISPECIES: TauD/TfdA family dioxygenase [unclassified Lysobacter]|uniref:TauD/TfdA family dioxygenase n=1 Tax=unclassified Lysobacter TaxID=2635362 RepID=UPI001BEA8E6E|nr:MULTISPECIES: TauD/TfdA family dioxygenase [unclassified Lysobacter]MBT2745386.1 TauD/TfdA family dioxygenase [Lysobacter sp. ISL-42]MBT2776928.1 TauD/TfdA family dioxygenase [Lysobacter sp. ISL-54]MBT2781448.1 TauD/TfdA family dioxygenase [Lysobacter sp. ISL-52]
MKVNSLFSATGHHPVVITPDGDASLQALHDYLGDNEDQVQQLLLRHGGILFRGFGVDGAEGFRGSAERLGARPFDYVGGNSPRSRVSADVYTSTEYPASEVISLHNEMSYLPSWPRRLFFYSLIPAASGGQTSLANSGDVLRALPEEIRARFRDKKVNYIRNFQTEIPLGKNWQTTYQTQDRAEVESIVAEQGSVCHWGAKDALRVSTRCEAFATHPQTGEEVWFNQAEQWHPSALNPAIRGMFEQALGVGNLPHECEYGDGEPIEENVLLEIRRALNTSKLLFDWQRNDLLMIDNILMMHGRESFKGERKTLAYLSAT